MSPRTPIAPREWFSAAELAEMNLPGLATTKPGVLLIAKREDWAARLDGEGAACCRKRAGRGGGLEYHVSLLPDAARLKLAMATPATTAKAEPQQSRESAWRRFESQPKSVKDEADRRLAIVQRVELLTNAGLGKARAVDEVVAGLRREARAAGKPCDVSETSVYEWFRRIALVDRADRLPYLAPAYRGRTKMAPVTPAAWQFFKDYYLRPKVTIAAAYQETVRIGEALGWVVPSEKTMARWAESRINRSVRILLREGEDALRRELPWIERDETTFHALEAINVDGHKWDVRADWGDGSPPERPMMVAIQDVYSRKFVAWRICRSENADDVRLTFAKLFRDYGIPRLCFFDNGRAFAAKWLTGGAKNRFRFTVSEHDPIGLLTGFGIEVHFTTPYHGQSKPVERAFRDLEEHVAIHPAFAGAFVGNNPLNKPHNHDSATAVPIATFMAVLEERIALHNARRGRDTNACGRVLSFDQAFNDSYAASRARIPMPTPEQLRQAMLCVERVKVRQKGEGIVLAKNRYWGDFLLEMVGETVNVHFEADDLHAGIHVYSAAGIYQGFADCWEKVGFASLEEGREKMRLQRKLRKAVAEQARLERVQSDRDLDAFMRSATPANQDVAPEPEQPNANVVAGAFRTVRNGKQAAVHTDKADEALIARARRGWT